MLNNETLLNNNNGRQIVVGYLSAVIDNAFMGTLDVVIHSDIPGVYKPDIRSQKTVSICVPYGTYGINKLMSTCVNYDQKIALIGYTSVNDDGFIWFTTDSVYLVKDDEEVVSTISIEDLKTPVMPRKIWRSYQLPF